MTGFVEVQFPPWISFWATGGRAFQTVVARTHGGQTYTNRDWIVGLGEWDIADALMTINNVDPVQGAYAFNSVRDLFNVVAGIWGGFRFKDWKDYQDEGKGICGATGLGTGVLTYQMNKQVTVGGNTYTQTVNKPVGSGACTLKKNAATAAGATYDPVTGLGTYVATATQTISTSTAGATTVLHLSGALTGAAIGKSVVVLGTSGDIGFLVNGKSATITAVSGTDVTINIATTGFTGGSGGTISIGPQPTDTIGWVGPYDIAARFALDAHAIGPDQSSGGLYDWQSAKIEEIRNP